MQKKIMLALIMSSNGMVLCQETPTTPVATAAPAQGQPAAQTNNVPGTTAASSVAPTETPVVSVTTQVSPPSVPAGQQSQIPPTTAVVIQPVVAPVPAPTVPTETSTQPTPVSVEIPATVQAPAQVSQPAEQPKPVEQPKQEEFKPQPQEIAEEEELEIKGIDTVDINEAKGNWLYKRIWWEKAERTYEKIKQLTDKILESRMSFFVKRNELDRTIVEFYSELGFKQGELSELIDFMTRQLDQERKAEGSLDEKERELLAVLTQEKKNIEQLQQGTQNILKIDRAIDDALMKLVEQLNQAKYYEQQAWEHFKAINRELSDKKARELFYSMDTYWRNLNSINSYLSDAFAKYFEQLAQKVQQETDTFKTNVQALSEKGISLQSQALAMRKECKIPPREEMQAEESDPATGVVGTLWGWAKAPFVAIGNLFGGMFSWVSGLFGGAESEELVLVKPARSAAKSAPESTEEPS